MSAGGCLGDAKRRSRLPAERRRGRIRVSLPTGEVEDLHTESRGEKLPHLLPSVRRRARGNPAEVSPGLPRHLQGTGPRAIFDVPDLSHASIVRPDCRYPWQRRGCAGRDLLPLQPAQGSTELRWACRGRRGPSGSLLGEPRSPSRKLLPLEDGWFPLIPPSCLSVPEQRLHSLLRLQRNGQTDPAEPQECRGTSPGPSLDHVPAPADASSSFHKPQVLFVFYISVELKAAIRGGNKRLGP